MEKIDNKKPSITPTKNGPYLVKNLHDLKNSKGEDIETKSVMTLCRCGQSNNKPFCDASHLKFGFESKKDPDRVADKTDDYLGKDITIHDNRGVCAHRSNCTKYSPKVFGIKGKSWIDPDGDDAEKTAKTIKTCPSGALSYTKEGILHKDLDRDPAIIVSKDGPYDIVGGPEFIDSEGNKPESKEHYTLCRCGASKNMPFCAGQHKQIDFKDEKN